jgi:peptidoglycan/LPS O-acetylase OafA/YrhL
MPSEQSGTRSRQSRGTRRNPGLDGLRGLAVALVVVFHVFPGLLPGGFLGVDVFFVLSGYLITGLLLRRFSDASGDRRRAPSRPWRTLRAFWISRFRRLLPELAALLLTVSVVASLAGPRFGSGLRAQVAAALVSGTNWLLIAHGQNYFAAFAAAAGHPDAPALQHLWSLAVEEQFYLVWPLVLWTLLRMVRARRRRGTSGDRHLGLAMLVGLAACGSFTLMADKSGTGSSDYYNTLTHCGGLLAGAAAALCLPLERVSHAASGRFARVVGGFGLGGLVVIVVLSICLNGNTDAPERGGIALASVAALAVLLAAACPGTDVARMLTWRPAVYLGERSYGVYLWHWPLIVLLGSPTSAPDVQAGVLRAILEFGLPVVLASLSRCYITAPARTFSRADVSAAWSRLIGRDARPWPTRAAAAVAAIALLPAFAGLSQAPSVNPDQSALQAQISAGSAVAAASTTKRGTGGVAPAEAAAGLAHAQVALPHLPALPPAGPPDPTLGGQVTAIGDSVLLASAQALAARLPGIVIDAKVGRQIWQAPDELEELGYEGLLRHYVVVALGTNGAFQQVTLDEIRDELGPDRVLVLVTVHMPRSWQAPVNSSLTRYAATHANTLLVNWNATISPYPGLLWPDATHPRPVGAQVYADLLAADLGSRAHE